MVFCVDNDGDNTFKYDKNEPTNKIIQAVNRLKGFGFHVSILVPETTGCDLNDILNKEGKGSLKQQLKTTLSPEEYTKRCQIVNDHLNEQATQKFHDNSLNEAINRPDFLIKKTIENTRINQDFTSRIKAEVMNSTMRNDLKNNSLNKINNPANFEREREL